MNIEKKMTQIWVGPKPAPKKWLQTWADKHPEWEYTLFDDNMLRSRKWKNQHLIEWYYKHKRFQGVSDLIRYELLYENGGFMPEADMVCLENTDELFTSPIDHCYTCYENEKGRPGNVQPIMACNPENPFLKTLVDTLFKLAPMELHPEPFRSTGNAWLAKMVPLHKPKITIFPSHYFIPQFYIKGTKRYDGPDKIYADHLWGSTGHGGTDYSRGV